MKTELKAKQLLGKQKNEGFTLIELLVVIIIVGVLSTIALPSFLNQVNKARSSEGRSNMGAINRSQEVYRLGNNRTATQLADLDVRISGKFYTYEVTGSITDPDIASAAATVANDNEAEGLSTQLKTYVSAVAHYAPPVDGTYPEYFGQVVCESLQYNVEPATPTPSTQNNVQATCPEGYLNTN
jgi:type IV pilus assembly protein PilA